ncbi:hypothetical protein Tco_0291543 [Tanacetum coccineum]
MSIIKEQHQALNDALVPREQHLRIGNYNYRLSTTFKPKKPTFQVALDKFIDAPFEEEILAFIRELSYPKEIKSLSDVKVDTLYQPWRTFGTIINKCLSGKVTGLDQLRLSWVQIIWDSPKSLSTTSCQRLSISMMKQVDWHYGKDDHTLTTMRFIPKHETIQKYGIIIPDTLTNQAMKESDEYKITMILLLKSANEGNGVSPGVPNVLSMVSEENRFIEVRDREDDFSKFKQTNLFAEAVSLIPDIVDKYLANQMNEAVKEAILLTTQLLDWFQKPTKPPTPDRDWNKTLLGVHGPIQPWIITLAQNEDLFNAGLRIAAQHSHSHRRSQTQTQTADQSAQTAAKQADHNQPTRPQQHAQDRPRQSILSEIALSKAEQMKIVTKRSKLYFHSSHASGSGANEGTGVSPGVPDVPTKDDDENVDNEYDDGQDDDNEQTKSDNDGDDFVHPKFSTRNEEERHDKEDKEEEGDNIEEEKFDEEQTNEEEEVNKMYDDVNINLKGRDTKMTDALLANVQTTQVIEDTHVIITIVTPEVQQQSSSVSSGFISNMLNPNPDTGIDSILNLNTESTSLVDVPITTNAEMPPSSITTLPLPPIPLIQPMHQTLVSTPTIAPSTSLQNLPTFGSLFKFEDRVKSLEDDFSKFKQTNLFAEAVSLIPDIVDKYLANQMNEAVKEAILLTTQLLDWFQKPTKPPTPDRDWNKTLLGVHGPIQPWIITLAQNEDLFGPTFKLMKGSCKSLVELEYFLEEVYKVTTDQLD